MDNSITKHCLRLMAEEVIRMEKLISEMLGALTASEILEGRFDDGFEQAYKYPDTEQECTYTVLIDIPTEND